MRCDSPHSCVGTGLRRKEPLRLQTIEFLPKLCPMPLIQVSAAFDDPDFLYKVKFDFAAPPPAPRLVP